MYYFPWNEDSLKTRFAYSYEEPQEWDPISLFPAYHSNN